MPSHFSSPPSISDSLSTPSSVILLPLNSFSHPLPSLPISLHPTSFLSHTDIPHTVCVPLAAPDIKCLPKFLCLWQRNLGRHLHVCLWLCQISVCPSSSALLNFLWLCQRNRDQIIC